MSKINNSPWPIFCRRTQERLSGRNDAKSTLEKALRIHRTTQFLVEAKKELVESNHKGSGFAIFKCNRKNQVKETTLALDGSLENISWKTTGSFRAILKAKNQLPMSRVLSAKSSGEKQQKFGFTIVTVEREYSFFAESKELRDLWVRYITAEKENFAESIKQDPLKAYIARMWETVDLDKSNTLNKDECLSVLARMNITCSKATLNKTFPTLENSNKVEMRDFVECMKNAFADRSEVRGLLMSATSGVVNSVNGEPCISVTQVLTWFDKNAKGGADSESLGKVDPQLRNVTREESVVEVLHMAQLLDSEQNSWMDPTHREPKFMDEPLCSYLINSSHNTYLTGDQLTSVSSPEMYREVLRRGGRCVELDVWDGSPGTPEGNLGDEPYVTHGFTACTKIFFRDCIRVIKEAAFEHNDYPVILSVENHCSARFQHRMAEICKAEFGEQLFVLSPAGGSRLLSPNELKRRFLIKDKLPPSSAPLDPDDELPPPGEVRPSLSPAHQELAAKVAQEKQANKHAAPVVLMDEAWKQLVSLPIVPLEMNIPAGTEADAGGKAYEVSNIAEGRAAKLVQDAAATLRAYTARRLMRVYPFGGRFDSSNLNPLGPWSCGAQIVSLNWQEADINMQLNWGRFSVNGGCGYVLKTAALRRGEPAAAAGGKDLLVEVLSCQRIPVFRSSTIDSVVDPYVVVEVYQANGEKQSKRTETVNDNGFNPTFKAGKLGPFTALDPEEALVRLAVMDDNLGRDQLAGVAVLPMSAIRPGVRHVPLRDPKKGDIMPFASVLARFDFV